MANRAFERQRFLPLSDTQSGVLLLIAALVALFLANSPWRETYHAVAGIYVGPEALGLRMTISHWAADGLLTIFFFVVGLELMQELRVGALRDPLRAAMPVIAAVLGMAMPALVYTGVQLATGSAATNGWAIPTATDIAFAVALLGVLGRGLPSGARVFLLTLAVVDDLLAIIVIAVFYSEGVSIAHLLGSVVFIALFGFLTRRRITSLWVLVPVALLAWAFMFWSGVHATIAGVALGMVVPAVKRADEEVSPSLRLSEAVDPLSKAVALPIFAFFAAGVTVVGGQGIGEMLTHPVTIGVVAGLVIGKPLGIWGGTAIIIRFTNLNLPRGVTLTDLFGVSMLAGIGFTVSLLIANLSFPDGDPVSGYARLAVIIGSFVSAIAAAIVLRIRSKAIARHGGLPEGIEPI